MRYISPASLPGAARAEPHRPRRSPSLTAPPASPPLERATGCPRGCKDDDGGAFFPFPPSSPALFPLQWCCCERRGPIRRWLAWPFLRQRGRIRVLVGRIQSPVARSGGRRARLPTSSGGWDAVVVWSAVGAAWVLSSCPLPCSGCAWAGRRRWQGKARWCGGRTGVRPDVQRCDVALAVGTVRAEAVVGHRRSGCGGGRSVGSTCQKPATAAGRGVGRAAVFREQRSQVRLRVARPEGVTADAAVRLLRAAGASRPL